jgi:hypothetical protein
VKYLEQGAFWGLEGLHSLQLSTNKLENFHSAMWSGLRSLKKLRLEMQTMKTVSGRIFTTLQSLEVLILYGMEIEEISGGAFEGKMTRWKVGGGEIKSRVIFHAVVKLRVLDLSRRGGKEKIRS